MSPIPQAIDVRPVSGRYRGASDRFEVVLRVDVDGDRALGRVSADYYRSGEWRGSMRVDAPAISAHQAQISIAGDGRFSWSTRFTAVSVTIPRVGASEPRALAALTHADANGVVGSNYACAFESSSFRTVMLEEGIERGVTPFPGYDTGLLASGGRARELSYEGAFAEAGIELECGAPTLIDSRTAGPGRTWSDAELHAAMGQYFGLLEDRPQWAIWLLHARAHDNPTIFGMMFDRRGRHRQGCAVFHDSMVGTGVEQLRSALFTCVHELGHGFNLPHCWQRSRATPPVPSAPDALSWMNYPPLYPGGEPAFWPAFDFRFDDDELAHLRHAFEDDVIMGGRPFMGRAEARELSGDWREIRGPNALRLRLGAQREFAFGEPVTIAIDLAATTVAGTQVPPVVGPRPGNVDIVIRRPDGSEFAFEPLLHHCRGEATVLLTARDRSLRDYAFIHYGKDGFAFERPGLYRVRARHIASDGSHVHSNVLSIRVLGPVTRADHAIGRLITGNDGIGTLMSLTGSDAPALDEANDTLQEIIDRYPLHPVASVARVVRATNAAREFKLILPGGRVEVRKADIARAKALVDPVIDVDAVYRATPGDAEGPGYEQEVAAALAQIGTKPGVAAVVDGFIASRRVEIAKVIPK